MTRGAAPPTLTRDPVLEAKLERLRTDPQACEPSWRPSQNSNNLTYMVTFFVGRTSCARVPGVAGMSPLGVIADSLVAQLTATFPDLVSSVADKAKYTQHWEIYARFRATTDAVLAFDDMCMATEYQVRVRDSDVTVRVPLRGVITAANPPIRVDHVPEYYWRAGFCAELFAHLGLRAASVKEYAVAYEPVRGRPSSLKQCHAFQVDVTLAADSPSLQTLPPAVQVGSATVTITIPPQL